MKELFISLISKSRKPKTGSNQLSKMYYGKTAASKKQPPKTPLWLGFWLLEPKAKAKSPTKRTLSHCTWFLQLRYLSPTVLLRERPSLNEWFIILRTGTTKPFSGGAGVQEISQGKINGPSSYSEGKGQATF